jgi:mRNA interferase YafQ
MLKVRYSSRFKKDFKAIQKRGYDLEIFEKVVGLLREEKPLPEKYRDHTLVGNYIGHRSCHFTPDWLLIYKIEKNILTLTLTRTGTHSDLYKK